MADYTGTADLAGAVPTFYGKSFLERLLPQVRMMEYVDKAPLPENNGTVVYFPRMTTPSTTVSASRIQYSAGREPITPGHIVSTQVSATLEKYGYAVAVQDVTQLAAITGTITEVTNNMADQAAQVLDTRIIEEAYGSSSKAVPANIHFSASLVNTVSGEDLGTTNTVAISSYFTTVDDASYKITAATIRKVVKRLKARNVLPRDDGYYAFICHSDTAMQLQADTTWQATYQYTDPENMRKGVAGTYGGVKVQIDNNIKSSALGSGGATVYYSLLLGKGSMGVTELNSVKYYTAAGGASKYDPIDEFITVGWKALMVPAVLNLSAGLVVMTTDA